MVNSYRRGGRRRGSASLQEKDSKGRWEMARKKQALPVSGRNFKVLLIEEPEDGYSVEVPELPGCFTEGDTLQEALANAREAIKCYLDSSAPPQPH